MARSAGRRRTIHGYGTRTIAGGLLAHAERGDDLSSGVGACDARAGMGRPWRKRRQPVGREQREILGVDDAVRIDVPRRTST